MENLEILWFEKEGAKLRECLNVIQKSCKNQIGRMKILLKIVNVYKIGIYIYLEYHKKFYVVTYTINSVYFTLYN